MTQLVNKTNQFNLTTIRRDEAEVSALIASEDHRVYAAEVSDRFGGYGLVAVAIVAAGAETWEVDTFLMSCRVLRRGVENAIVQCIADDAAEAGATLLRGRLPAHGQELARSPPSTPSSASPRPARVTSRRSSHSTWRRRT